MNGFIPPRGLIPTTGLVLDLDPARGAWTDTARTTAARTGDAVAAVTDSSASGLHATQGTAANRFVLAFDGRGIPVLRSNRNGTGSGNGPVSSLSVPDAAALRPGTGELRIFAVYRPRGDLLSMLLCKGNGSGSTVTGYSILTEASTKLLICRCRDASANRASRSLVYPGAQVEPGPVLIEYRLTGSAVVATRNGSASGFADGGGGPTAASYAGSISNTDNLLIGYNGTTSYFQGDVYRVAIYQGAMSDADAAAARLALTAAYRTDLTPAPAAAATVGTAVAVYTNGTGYPAYRIPVLASTPTHTLAFAEGRASVSDAGNIDVVLKRSTDEGATWGALSVVAANGTDTAQNPCPILQTTTGRLFLLYCTSLGTDTEAMFLAGTNTGSRQAWVIYSDDHGATWSAPAEITSQVKPAGGSAWFGFGPDNGVCLSSGRLVAGAYWHGGPGGSYYSRPVYSDDGLTWTRAAYPGGSTGPADLTESVVADVGSKLVQHSRHQNSPWRWTSESYDGGATWSYPYNTFALWAQACNGGLADLGGGWLGASMITDTATRQNADLLLSRDGGSTWPRISRIYTGMTQYTSLWRTVNGTPAVLIERDTSGTPNVAFYPLTLPA